MSRAAPSTHIAGRCVTSGLNLLPLSVHSGHGGTCCRLDPVANDPKLTDRYRDGRSPGSYDRSISNSNAVAVRSAQLSNADRVVS
jgi:hypothetical protein